MGEIGIGPNPKLRARLENADLLLLANGRMAEMPSQSYTLLDIPSPRQKLVHIHPDPAEIGRVYHPALGNSGCAVDLCGGAGKRAAAP